MSLPASCSPNIHFLDLDGAVELRIARPERKNALSREMYAALAQGLAHAAADPGIRAVLLRGEGGSFTSGNDLRDFQAGGFELDGGPVGDFLRAVVGFSKPLVAAVEGHAIGIGTTLLLHCDLVVAAHTARFQLPFVRLGLVPEAGSSLLLPLMAGHRKASRLLLLGEPFDAATALDVGIVGELVEPEALHARAEALVAALVALPAGALRESKRLMKAPVRAQLEAVMQAEVQEFVARLGSPEAMEAFLAFFEKRAPDFRRLG